MVKIYQKLMLFYTPPFQDVETTNNSLDHPCKISILKFRNVSVTKYLWRHFRYTAFSCTHTCACAHTRARMHKYTCMLHMYMHVYAHAHSCGHTHLHTPAYTLVCMDTHTSMHTCTYKISKRAKYIYDMSPTIQSKLKILLLDIKVDDLNYSS